MSAALTAVAPYLCYVLGVITGVLLMTERYWPAAYVFAILASAVVVYA